MPTTAKASAAPAVLHDGGQLTGPLATEETPLDRELQATELARIMAESYPNPVIFLGYVVTHPLAPRPAPYEIMATDGRVHDIDEEDNDRWCVFPLVLAQCGS